MLIGEVCGAKLEVTESTCGGMRQGQKAGRGGESGNKLGNWAIVKETAERSKKEQEVTTLTWEQFHQVNITRVLIFVNEQN